jgi:hypothetical protein
MEIMKKLFNDIKTSLQAHPVWEIGIFIWAIILASTVAITLVGDLINYVLKHI